MIYVAATVVIILVIILLELLRTPAPAPMIGFFCLTVEDSEGNTESNCAQGDLTMAFQLRADQKVSISVSFVDAQGNPAVADDTPVWDSSDASIVSVVAAPDGLSAVATASGVVGTAQVSVKADADLGDGIKEIVGTLDLDIVSGEATSVVLSPGTPEPK